MYDTVKGSDWLGDQDAIEYMCKNAMAAVVELEHMGMPFSRTEDGRIYQRPFGGHSVRWGEGLAERACAAADRTGHAMLHTLYQQCLKHGTEFFIEYVALDLVGDDDGTCRGVLAWRLDDGTLHLFRARERDHILLHLEHLDPELLRARLPGIAETARIFGGVDLARQPVPILPTAHYNMGGIPTNLHAEVLDPSADDPERMVPGLMAVGEAACVSVHGATRLGTNSLLDLVVFGRAAADRAAATIERARHQPSLPENAAEAALARFDRLRHARGGNKAGAVRLLLQRTMQDHCAVFRSAALLEAGLEKLAEVGDGIADLAVADRSLIWNTDLVDALELDNLIGQAATVLHSARFRTESRGAHAREDYPLRDDENWLVHTLAWRGGDGNVRLGTRPVHLNPLSNEVGTFPPAERVY
jgi:succinate dehydrogenase/fumarate reductase flavoprotein subunit